jgi:hypothetical protein
LRVCGKFRIAGQGVASRKIARPAPFSLASALFAPCQTLTIERRAAGTKAELGA